MTTAAGRPLSRFNACARRMSHYSMWFTAWLCITNLISRLTSDWPEWAQWVDLAVWLFTAMIPLLMAYYGDQVHVWAWDCPTCVARTPILHGAEVAQRHRRRLQWMHLPKRVLVYALGSLVLYSGAPFLIRTQWYLLATLPFYGIWIYTCLAGEAHRNLQPWCPWCQQRRGDGDVPVDVVPPNPVGTKTNA